jgi:hypothetical protein
MYVKRAKNLARSIAAKGFVVNLKDMQLRHHWIVIGFGRETHQVGFHVYALAHVDQCLGCQAIL